MDLDATSIIMLEELNKLYINKKYVCFIHKIKEPQFYTFHFHIVKKNEYDRVYSRNNSGLYLLSDIYLNNLMYFLNTNKNYYEKYNVNFLNY